MNRKTGKPNVRQEFGGGCEKDCGTIGKQIKKLNRAKTPKTKEKSSLVQSAQLRTNTSTGNSGVLEGEGKVLLHFFFWRNW